MALYKQSEFAQKCGVSIAYVSVNKKRGKVIVNDDDLVDGAHPANKLFMEKCAAKAVKKGKSSRVPVKKETKAKSKVKEKVPVEQDQRSIDRFNLDTEKQRMAVRKMEKENFLLDMQHKKILGKLIPTDLVKALFGQHFKSVTISFKQAADKLMTSVSKKAKIDRNTMAEMRAEMIEIINKAVEDGLAETKKNINNIVAEYSQQSKKL